MEKNHKTEPVTETGIPYRRKANGRTRRSFAISSVHCCWNRVCRKVPAKLTRPVCLTASSVLVLGILFAVVFMILPSLRESGDEFIQNIPLYVDEIGLQT